MRHLEKRGRWDLTHASFQMMRTLILTLLLGLFCFSLQSPAIASVQDGPDPAKQVESFRRYLSRKPLHDWAFDKLIEAASSINGLQGLITEYAERVESDKASKAERIILARLYDAVDRTPEALEILLALKDPEPQVFALIGRLELDRGQPARALEALDKAVTGTEDRKLLENLHSLRGQALLASGKNTEAVAAFRALAELEPENFHLRLTAASELSRHSLVRPALDTFAKAEELAGDDAAKRCQVLSEMGRLHERLQEPKKALEVYGRANELMGRGHWLKRDLYDRMLELHRAGQTLGALAEELAGRIEARPSDVDSREFLARVQRAQKNPEGAKETLQAAVKAFPEDLGLSRSLIDLLTELDDLDGAVQAYQNAIAAHPAELELYMELGTLLAGHGRLEAAKLQWGKTLQNNLNDPGLCSRLAALYALHGAVDEAIPLLQKAQELEPDNLRHTSDWVDLLQRHERKDEVPALLEAAQQRAWNTANPLADVSDLWNRVKRSDQALICMERAYALDPEQSSLASRLASLRLKSGDLEGGTDLLEKIINSTRENALRTSAIGSVVRAWRDAGKAPELLERVETRVGAKSQDPSDYLLLGQLLTDLRRPAIAMSTYESLLEFAPKDVQGRLSLARLLEEMGDYPKASEHYRRLITERPQGARPYLRRLARIQLELYNQDEAFELFDEILATSPGNAAAFLDVAKEYKRLNRWDRSIQCLLQAIRIQPEDGFIRLELADAYRQMGDLDKSREHTLVALEATDDDVQRRARKGYTTLIGEMGLARQEIARLQKVVEDNPYNESAPFLLTAFYMGDAEYEQALSVIEEVLTYRPRQPRLVQEKARLLSRMERYDEAAAAIEAAWKLPDADTRSLSRDLAKAWIKAGDLEKAKGPLTSMGNPLRGARLLKSEGYVTEAIALLEEPVRAGNAPGRTSLFLAELMVDAGRRDDASEILSQLLARQGESFSALLKVGDLLYTLDQKEEVRHIGVRLFALLRQDQPKDNEKEDREFSDEQSAFTATPRYSRYRSNRYARRLSNLDTFYEEKGLDQEFVDAAIIELGHRPNNRDLLQRAIYKANDLEKKAEALIALLDKAREGFVASGRPPTGYTSKEWTDFLDNNVHSALRQDDTFADEYLTALGSSDDLTVAQCLTAAKLAQGKSDDEGLETWMARAVDLASQPGNEVQPDVHVLAAQAAQLLQRREYEAALEPLKALEAALKTEPHISEAAQRRAAVYQRGRENLTNSVPAHLLSRVTPERLKKLHLLKGLWSSKSLGWGPGSTPELDRTQISIAKAQLKLQRLEDGIASLHTLVEDSIFPEHGRVLAARLLFTENHYQSMQPFVAPLREYQREMRSDPVLKEGLGRSWSWRQLSTWESRILREAGDVVGACTVLLKEGNLSSVETLLTETDSFGVMIESLQADLDEAAASLPAEGDLNPVDPAVLKWRNAGVMLGHVQQIQRTWKEHQELYENMCARMPEAFEVRKHLAQLHQRSGDIDTAMAEYGSIIERKKALNRAMRKPPTYPDRLLSPTSPLRGRSTSNSLYFYGGTNKNMGFDTSADTLQWMSLAFEHDMYDEAMGILTDLIRETGNLRSSSIRWSLPNLLKQYDLKSKGLPLLRMLSGQMPDDIYINQQYVESLILNEDYAEAQRILQGMLRKPIGLNYYRAELEKKKALIGRLMGEEDKITVEDLEKRVAEAPRNAQARHDLCHRLMKELRDVEALAEARVAYELAPHRDDVYKLYNACLLINEEHAERKELLIKRREKTKDLDERQTLSILLANFAFRDGNQEEGLEYLRTASRGDVTALSDFSPAVWLKKNGYDELANTELDLELERLSHGNWSGEEARAMDAGLKRSQGQLEEGFKEFRKQYKENSSRYDRTSQLSTLKDLLKTFPGFLNHVDTLRTIANGWEGLEGQLLHIAILDLSNDRAGAEEAIRAAIAAGDGGEALYTTLLARQAADNNFEGVLQTLQDLEDSGLTSHARRTSNTLGSITEVQALHAARAHALHKLGRTEESQAQIDRVIELEKDEKALRQLKNQVHGLLGERTDQIRMLREKIDREGPDNASWHNQLAVLLESIGNDAEAAPLYERGFLLSGRRTSSAKSVYEVKKRLGEETEWVESIRERAAADPLDKIAQDLLSTVGSLAKRPELEREAAERIAEMREHDRLGQSKLMGLELKAGNREAALAHLETLTTIGKPSEKRNSGAILARIWAAEGKKDQVRELVTELWKDRDPQDYPYSFMSLLRDLEMHEMTLEISQQYMKFQPDNYQVRSVLIDTYLALKMYPECGQELRSQLFDYERSNEWDNILSQLSKLIHRCGPDALLDPESADWNAIVWTQAGEAEKALPLLEAALESNSKSLLHLICLCKVNLQLGDLQAALKNNRRTATIADCERARRFENPWSYFQPLNTAESNIQMISRFLGNYDQMIAEANGPPWYQFPSQDPWEFSYYNFGDQYYSRTPAWQLMRTSGQYQQVVEELQRKLWQVNEYESDQYWPSYYDALYQVGERELVLEMLWRHVGLRLGGNVDSYSKNALFELWHREDRLSELMERVQAKRAELPDNKHWEDLENRILAIQGNLPDELTKAQEEFAKEPWSGGLRDKVMNQLLKKGDWLAAIPLVEQGLNQPGTEKLPRRMFEYDPEKRSALTFKWGGASSSRNYNYFGSRSYLSYESNRYRNSSRGSSKELLIALYQATDQPDKAAPLLAEFHLRRELNGEDLYDRMRALLQSQIHLKAWDLARATTREMAAFSDEKRAGAYSSLLGAARTQDDASIFEPCFDEYWQARQAEWAKSPFAKSKPGLLALAKLFPDRVDSALVEAELERLLKFSGLRASSFETVGQHRLLQGRYEEALSALTRAQELQGNGGRYRDWELQRLIGVATLHVHGLEKAAPLLREYLAFNHTGPDSEKVRSMLES